MDKKKLLVNLITLSRGIGALFLIPIFYNFGPAVMGASFLGFIATDFIDGFLARKLNCSSFFGAILDGMIDKLFTIIALGLLITISPSMIVPLIIEGGILAVGMYSASKGNTAKSSLIGKLKVWVMAITIGASFLISDYNSVQQFLNWQFLPTLTPAQIKSILDSLAMGATIAEGATLISYIDRDIKETKTETKDFNRERQKLLRLKSQLQSQKEKLTREEFMYRLFDTNYYQENKDKPMRFLLKKD